MSLLERLAPIQAMLLSAQPEWIPVEFGPWLPDLPDFGNPGLTIATNVIPATSSYRPFPALTVQSAAIDARARGATAAKTTAGDTYFYVGNASKLYSVFNQAVTDVSIAGGYTTAAGDSWEFTIFGNTLIATNYGDPVQSITIGSSTPFADHFTSTKKPNGKHLAVVGQFLMLGNINDSADGVVPHRAWWSGTNDSLDMDPDSATQSDFQDFPEGGAVQRIVSGTEYGLIFQDTMIRRATYAGSPLVFNIVPIERRHGTPIPNSVISRGRQTFYIGEEGFHYTDGSQSTPIGHGQVDRSFWAEFDIANIARVSAALDPVNTLVGWLYPGSGSTGGMANKIICYNYVDRKWSSLDIDADLIVSALTQGFTLESLDAVFLDSTADTTLDATEAAAQTIISVTDETLFAVGNAVRINLDDGTIHQANITTIGTGTVTIDVGLPSQALSGNRIVRTSIDAPGYASLDSPAWQGGKYRLAAFDRDNKLNYFTGANLAATLETGERQVRAGKRSRITKTRPLIDGAATVTTAVAGRKTLSVASAFGSALTQDSIGEGATVTDSRYHKFRTSIASGTWGHAQGIEVLAGPRGDK